MSYLLAQWPAPDNIVAGVTTRISGVSQSPYANNNLALHVGDDENSVNVNRQRLDEALAGIKKWQWLEQVHGVEVVKAPTGQVATADACYTDQESVVCTVLTADCLPVLLCNQQGSEVAAIHAGWRGLCDGVIEETVAAMTSPAEALMVWFGPAIGPLQFEVGHDVYKAFVAARCGAESASAFTATAKSDKYLCDIYHLARIRLASLGISRIYGGEFCTVTDQERFYSYRREGVTGRMASFIYFQN